GYLAGRRCASRAGALRKRKENQPPMNADEHRYNHGVLIRVHLRLSAAQMSFWGNARFPKREREESDMFQFSSEQFRLKVGLAEMLKGGVIMDVTNAEQAKIAEDAGASAMMATVNIPVMAKARIGHFMEARVLEALGVDFIDESEVLTPADEEHHIDKNDFKVPFVCGARNLGEALRRIGEGAAMIRTKGEAGSGNIVEAVRHIRTIVREMKQLTVL